MNLWFDPQSDGLVYDLPEPSLVLSNVRESRPLTNGYVYIPRSLYNLQMLSFLGLPVVPIADDSTYDWPIKKGMWPREHQKLMTNFMLTNPRCFNLSDMGTMKTLAALWAADFLMSKSPGVKALIVARLSILQRVWGDAILQHFIGRRTFTILHGDPNRRARLLAEGHDFYIINFDGIGVGARYDGKRKVELAGFSKSLAERDDIQICIIDEASAYREGNTRRHRVARTMFGAYPYMWLLTGTPTPNGPLDAHGLARLLNGEQLHELFTNYKRRVMMQVAQWKWVPKPGAHVEAQKLLQPSIRFEMRECTDVPPCTEQMRDVALSGEQEKYFKELKNELSVELTNGTRITPAHEAALRQKLIQISCGAVYDTEHRVTRIDCKPRLDELRAVIREANRKIIVFAPLTSVLHLLYEELTEWSRALVYGATPPKVRDEIFRQFQTSDDPHILIADPGTMSYGLDLFAASVVVWYGATDRTELYLQANRRIDRPGQQVATTIVQLAASPIEREIFRRAAANQSMQGAILDLVRAQ
jgi:SNF2 family DNA or RNA helicase